MGRTPIRLLWWVVPGVLAGMPPAALAAAAVVPITRISALRTLATEDPSTNCSFQLEADVWWANPAEGRYVLHDGSGTEEVEMECAGPTPKAGERVRLAGTGTIVRRGAGVRLGNRGPVVDNDGVHSLTEKSGAVYLTRGRHAYRLEWFNGSGRFGLELEYEGPGIPRRKIPESAWLLKAASGSETFVNGADYQCYEGTWTTLPDFNQLKPVKTGTTTTVDVAARTRDNYVGLAFRGIIDIPREGTYRFYVRSDDGSRLFVGEPTLDLSVIGKAVIPVPARMIIGQLLPDDSPGGWAEVEGRVTLVRGQDGGLQLELRAGSGRMRVDVADHAGLPAAQLLDRRIRAVGFCQGTYSTDGERVAGVLLVPGGADIHLLPAAPGPDAAVGIGAESLPLLTTASAVRELPPDEARRGYPVRLEGVVTCVQPDGRAFVLQDTTMGLYVATSTGTPFDVPRVGEFLRMDGVTDQPGIARLRDVTQLGEGTLPDPVHPAWDQLMNGSLDSQWVEIGGLIESLVDRSNGWSRVMLRTRAGVLKVDVRQAGVEPGPIGQYENAVVRLRGCIFADWLPDLRLKVGQVRMFDVDVLVDRPAPVDVFSLPRTTAAALMRFDPAFDVSRRVKVCGQVVYVRGADYFVMDGGDGLRFMAKEPLGLEAGDLVEAVGYPELSGAAPVLRGAVGRKTGHAALPPPKTLTPDDLIRANLDATRVRIDGSLTGLKQTSTNLVLELQAGAWRFLGRLNTTNTSRGLQVGSRLEVTGVYCAQGGYAALGTDFAPLDLLVSDPADIRVLARPPWWTLPRLLVIVGLLVCAVALMVLWITQLHRQVEERTAELGRQIQHREQLEYQRAIEQERARIAQDLHDQLGSDIATVSMLASRAQFASATDEKRSRHLEQVRLKAREMVASLDEIVWAMNPVHDSVASLESYLGRYAARFLELANIGWQFEVPPAIGDHPVDSRRRHQLFLVFKEALTNIVRHSGATEVRASLRNEEGELQLTIADNGRGLPAAAPSAAMNGVAGMRARIEKLGGRFEIGGEPGAGTTVRVSVPLS